MGVTMGGGWFDSPRFDARASSPRRRRVSRHHQVTSVVSVTWQAAKIDLKINNASNNHVMTSFI
jgi:hypothetical protein